MEYLWVLWMWIYGDADIMTPARLCWHLAPRLLVSDGCLVSDRQQNVNEFYEFGQKKRWRCWPGAV